MEQEVTLLDDLKRMKEEMDRVWNELFENTPEKKEEVWKGRQRKEE
jgi:hypothetical protein